MLPHLISVEVIRQGVQIKNKKTYPTPPSLQIPRWLPLIVRRRISHLSCGMCFLFKDLLEAISSHKVTISLSPSQPFWYYFGAPLTVCISLYLLQYKGGRGIMFFPTTFPAENPEYSIISFIEIIIVFLLRNNGCSSFRPSLKGSLLLPRSKLV